MIQYYKSKFSAIFAIFSDTLHLSRKKFIFAFILSLIEQKSVQFPILAPKLNSERSESSNLRRIQSFFSDYALDYTLFARVLYYLLGSQKLLLSIDRTNWKFGTQNINILALTAYYKGIGFPLFFKLLDKRGNSNYQERIDLLGEFVSIFGSKRIARVVGDREFIGHQWLAWLQEKQIPFVMRLPKHHHIKLENGEVYEAEKLVGNKNYVFYENATVDQIKTNIVIKRLQGELLILIGKGKAKNVFKIYRKRWSIEVFFQACKKRGFNLEDTHLKDLERLKKLMVLVAITFTFCLKIGIWKHQKIQEIPYKNHGYKAKSFFRYGLDVWANITAFIHQRQEKIEKLLDLLLQEIRQRMQQEKIKKNIFM